MCKWYKTDSLVALSSSGSCPPGVQCPGLQRGCQAWEAYGQDIRLMATVDMSPLSAAPRGPEDRRVVGLGAQLGQSW